MTTPALRDWIREDHGLDVVELTRVHGGADLAAEVWKARALDGGSRADAGRPGGHAGAAGTADPGGQPRRSPDRLYAVKWSGGGTDAGALVTEELADAGVVGVGPPVRTLAGGLWSLREGRRLTVVPWVDGRGAAEVGLTDEQWTAYGVLLRRVHSVEPSEELKRKLPRLNPVNARMPGLLRELDERLTEREPADAIEAELGQVWREHLKEIRALLDPVDEPRGEAVICHADPHLGNVIVGERVHLIDWDDAVLAPREQDMFFMLGGMGSLGTTTPAHLESFFTGYGPVELVPVNLRYYRHARALEDVALWAEQVITGPDREQSLDILRGVLGPDGLVKLVP